MCMCMCMCPKTTMSTRLPYRFRSQRSSLPRDPRRTRRRVEAAAAAATPLFRRAVALEHRLALPSERVGGRSLVGRLAREHALDLELGRRGVGLAEAREPRRDLRLRLPRLDGRVRLLRRPSLVRRLAAALLAPPLLLDERLRCGAVLCAASLTAARRPRLRLLRLRLLLRLLPLLFGRPPLARVLDVARPPLGRRSLLHELHRVHHLPHLARHLRVPRRLEGNDVLGVDVVRILEQRAAHVLLALAARERAGLGVAAHGDAAK
mmetsp:Transcript_30307/g.94734  ORF Transcript_30307/g.94734 Transcript_30307/m.94734 type:complete len:264 (-) Transcript_30307:71-862(-)